MAKNLSPELYQNEVDNMQDIERFAGEEGGFTTGDVRWEPYLERVLLEYIEKMSILRNYVQVLPIPIGTWSMKIPRNYPTGMAVDLSEGSEIPRVRQVVDVFELSVAKYGTAAEMTDEAKETDWLGILGRGQMQEAAKRMQRKQDYDIADVMLNGYETSVDADTSGQLQYEDVVSLKTEMIKKDIDPNTMLVNPDEYADLQIDDRFVNFYQSGTDQTLRNGVVGRVAGIDLVPTRFIPAGFCLMMDTSLNPVVMVTRSDVRVAQTRDEERQVDAFFMTAWSKPAVVRPVALGAIIVE
jgi:N4-gp56 family major capsid protein